MRRILVALASVWCAGAQQDVKVTYFATQASVQDIARTIVRQAGLEYNWQRSFNQTNPQCWRFMRDVQIDAVPFAAAMQRILGPVGLRYAVESGEVVLYKAPGALPADVSDRTITYSTGKKRVQHIAIDLAKQVGLGYNWDKSVAQADPECRQFVDDVSIEKKPFGWAMVQILGPVGLRYEAENGKVVLYRQ
jgi:hypothetical protein